MLAALVIGAAAHSARAEGPDLIPPSFRAADRDPTLTRIARTALPLIAAIERVRAASGAFPVHAADLAPLLPEGVAIRDVGQFIGIGDWLYYRRPDGSGYVLSRKLSWDPRLVYDRDLARPGAGGRWVYDPGDGSAETDIVLEP